MSTQTWFLPAALLVTATVVAFPLSRYLAWIIDGKYKPLPVLGWLEKRLDSGPQDWKQYAGSLLLFNTVLFVFWLYCAGLPAVAAAKCRRQSNAGAEHDFQQRSVVHDEYRYSALCR